MTAVLLLIPTGPPWRRVGSSRWGLCLLVVGVIVHLVGSAWIDRLMPPIVTGAIVALIGFNLAPAAWGNVTKAP